MKKLFSAVFSALMLLLLAAPAYADAALPRRYYYRSYIDSKWIIAIAVAVVIVAAGIVIAALRYRKQQLAAEQAKFAAESKQPEDK